MRRIVYDGIGLEILHTQMPSKDGPMDVRILRFIDSDANTLHDFPMTEQMWADLMEKGKRPDDALKDFQVIKAMPDALRNAEPPRRPNPPR